MKNRIFRALCLLLCMCALLGMLPGVPVHATEEDTVYATDISGRDCVTAQQGFPYTTWLFDKSISRKLGASKNSFLTLTHPEGIGSVYFLFEVEPGLYTVTNNDTGEQYTAGEANILHDFLDMEAIFGEAPNSVTIQFLGDLVYILEMYVYTPGQVPEFIQKWEAPKDDRTDLILFSTHGDDEHLFFGGLLPYYAQERDYEVLVVYLTNHRNQAEPRCREMLAGLWAVGVRTHPVIGGFYDGLCRNVEQSYQMHAFNRGETKEQMLRYVVEQLRRYKPKVVVGHDPINGEYGHGQHMMYAELLMEALEISNDPTVFPELAEKYGVWEVPKAYLHMWPENPIVFDWDQPLESFGGMTAFEVSRDLGFAAHESQQFAFSVRFYGKAEKATDIDPSWSPMYYGLYRSTVGPDTGEADFFENLMSYREEEEARLAAEAAAAEAQRKAEEEASRAAEESAAAEASRAAEESAAAEASRAAAEAEAMAQQQKKRVIILTTSLSLLAAAAALSAFLKRRAVREEPEGPGDEAAEE